MGKVVVSAGLCLLGLAYARLAYYRWRLRQAQQESARLDAQEPVSSVTVYDQDGERLVREVEAFLGHPSQERPT